MDTREYGSILEHGRSNWTFLSQTVDSGAGKFSSLSSQSSNFLIYPQGYYLWENDMGRLEGSGGSQSQRIVEPSPCSAQGASTSLSWHPQSQPLFGKISQASYSVANTYQDSLARHRVSQREKVASLELGALKDDGILTRMTYRPDGPLSTGWHVSLWRSETLGIFDHYCDPKLGVLFTPDASANH